MSKYIEVDAVEKAICKRVYAVEVEDILAEMENAPSIDIVRCKECKYCVPYSTCGGDWQMCMRKIESSYDVMLNDFCSYGERKESE